LSALTKNRCHFPDLRKVNPDAFGDRERNRVRITDAVLVMIFRPDPVDAVFFWMKIIKTAFKPDHQEKKEARSNTDRKPQGIDEGIAFIAFEVSESCLEIIFKHGKPL
jgi:hypothetical protein